MCVYVIKNILSIKIGCVVYAKNDLLYLCYNILIDIHVYWMNTEAGPAVSPDVNQGFVCDAFSALRSAATALLVTTPICEYTHVLLHIGTECYKKNRA